MRFNRRDSSAALKGLLLVIALLLAAVCTLFAPGNEARAQAAVPAAPTGLTAPTVAHDSVTLVWDDPGDSSITGYQVLRRSRDGDEYGDGLGAAEFAAIVDDTGSAATTYTDTSVTVRTRYVYRVKARSPRGLSEKSSYVRAETTDAPSPTSPPSMPTGLAVSSTSHDGVTLTWDDPGDSTIESYQVLRRSRDGSEYGDGLGDAGFAVIVDDTGSSATTYTDTSVAARTRYAYGVKARNPHGLSEASGSANAETSEAPTSQAVQPCRDGYVPPTPTDVAVTAVPIVVESTTADYFVLYVNHDVDDTAVWYPVQVTPGEDGTTTLSENVAALPKERYRVEKYLIANPADVDGDCTDDIIELNDLGAMNPLNPVASVALSAVAVPDRETFEALAYTDISGTFYIKFTLVNMDAERPIIYFQNTRKFLHHLDFLAAAGLGRQGTAVGKIIYDPEFVAPDGSRGVYRFSVDLSQNSLNYAERTYTMLAASMPLLDDNLALWIQNHALPAVQANLSSYRASRMNLVFDEDVYGETSFLALNPGEGYGLLRSLEPDERPNSRDVVIYETLPNELPRVAGIISTVPQTPLSHINLRALQDGVPNAFIADALEDDYISDLIDSHVHYAVTETGYSIRAATQSEMDESFASSRPAQAQTPQRDLTVTSITPLSEIGFDDWDSFGVKAANVAVLGTLGFPEGTVPDGFAVPFFFYDEFMKHNGLYDDIEEMLADSDFQTDYDTKADELKKLRKKIKKAETPEWIETALTSMHASFPEGTSLRYRSSTNNEDLPNFNGAGLYDSKTQHPEETGEDGISKSLKQVYASMWNFRAFIERDFHRVDHLAAAMGVLVHPNYSDELVNGVAVSVDPAYGTEGTYYVNSQVGEDLVTNPEAYSVPEEVLLWPDGSNSVAALSNQVPLGQLLMTDDQLTQLRRHLTAIHERFAELYGVEDGERFAMEIEFKITSDNILAIKQARPWVFTDQPPEIEADRIGATDAALTGSFDVAPATHDGNPFRVRVRFSEIITLRRSELAKYAVTVTGGKVKMVDMVDRRNHLWDIWVIPDSQADVTTVALPHNRPCTVLGAICRFDGQRLSNPLELTVKRRCGDAPPRLSGNITPTGTPTIGGTAIVGRTLTAHTSGIADADGMDNVSFSYRWLADDTEIAGAYGATYTLVAADQGNTIEVRACFTDDAGNEEMLTSAATAAVVDTAVWESELTAGHKSDYFPAASGYSIFGDLGGTLAPDGFVIDGTTYSAHFLVHASDSLWLGMDRELPMDFTMFVGDSTYLGSESMVPPSIEGVHAYWWPSGPPGWSADGPVQVSLTIHPGFPLGSRQKAPVTGYFSNFPSEHDGNEDISFRIYFSEGVATTADALRDHVLAVSGGTVSSVRAVGSEGRIWAVSVTPHSKENVAIEIEADLDCALPSAVCTADGRRLFNRIARRNNPPTGAPTISGSYSPWVGETPTVDTSNISDPDGMDNVSFSYQWLYSGGGSDAVIEGARQSGYTLSDADRGRTLRVRVSFTDDAGFAESLTSASVTILALEPEERPHRLLVTVATGTITLTWQDPDTHPTIGVYQILRHRPELGEPEPLVYLEYISTPHRTFTDNSVEPGVLYAYAVKAVKDPFGYLGPASAPVEVRMPTIESSEAPQDNRPASGTPTIIGAAHVGESLTADTSGIADAEGLDNVSYSYQWIRNDGSTGADIAGATGATYTVTSNDEGKTVRVRVSFTDDGGNEETLTSAPTARVASSSNNPATGLPTIRGQVRVGATLRASLSALDDADGLSGATFTYQWLADDEEIQDATDSTYALDADNEGQTIKVRVSFTDDAGNEETLTSAPAATAVPAKTADGRTKPPPAPLNLTARANDDGSVTVSWDAPNDDSITGYRVLRRQPGEAEFSMAESEVHTGGTETTYTDDHLTLDVLHAYSVRAINAAGSSERSNYDNAVPHRLIPIDMGLGAPTIFLTFDDGPREPYTAQMLDVLEKYGARATFFVTGLNAALHPGIMARMAAARHGIGNHTWQHERLTSLSRENFNSTVSRTQEQIGAHATRCLRPPYGATDANTAAWSASLGLQQMTWTLDLRDYTAPGVDSLVSGLSQVSNGSVVLLHEHGGGGDTIEAVRIMLDRWARQGYQFKPVCEPPRVPVAPPNNSSTGAPRVSGRAQVGKLLTSNTPGIADADGMSGASFSYQWYADNAKIANATNSFYLIAAEHEGKTVMVEVSFADDAGNIQRLTSVPTAAVAEAERVSGSPGAPQDLSVSPTDSTGELSVTWNAPRNNSGPEITGYRVEWKLSSGYWGTQSDVREIRTTGTTHRITGLAEASQYAVRVRAASQLLEGPASVEVLAAPMGPAPLLAEFWNKPASHEGAGSQFNVYIAFSEDIDHGYIELRDGTVEVNGGVVLEAGGADRPPDSRRLVILPHGSGHVTITLPASEDCSIWGAICTADGKKLSNRLELTIPGPSTPVPAHAPDNAPANGAPAVTGAVQVGQPLMADISGIADPDGLNNAVFTYQWLADDVEIQDATDSTYVLDADDEGKTIKVRVSFTDDGGTEETLTSDATPGVVGATSQPVDFHILDAPVGENEAVLYRSTATLTPVNHFGNTHDSSEERRASFAISESERLRLRLLDKLLIGSLSAPISATDLTIPLTSVSGLRPGESIQVGADGGELIRIASVDAANQTIAVAERYQVAAESFVAPRAWPAETVVYHHRRARPERLPGYMIESGERPTFNNFRMVWTGLDVPYLGINVHFTGSDTELKNWRELLVYLRFRRGDDQGTMIEGILPLGADGELNISHRQPGNPYTVREQHLRRYLGWPEDLDSEPNGTGEVSFVHDLLRGKKFVEGSERTFLREIVDWIYADDGHDLGRIYRLDDRYSPDDRRALQRDPDTASEGLVRSYQVVVDLVFLDGTDSRIDADNFSISADSGDPENAPATGAPIISGTAQVAETLTADTSGIADEDGLDNATFSYQWLADDAEIESATSVTYTLAEDDGGKTIKVRVSFTDDGGNEEALTSAVTAAVAAEPNTPVTGAPTINGTAQVGETLTVDTSNIADEDGLTNVAYSYQWLAGGADIEGATGSSYTLTAAQEGQTVQVRVSFTYDADGEETRTRLTSSATAAVSAPNSPATGAPTISGTVQVGETLTADTSSIADDDGLDNASFSYQWVSNDGIADSDIAGATASTYTPGTADEGKTIKVRVSFTDDANNEETLTSAATVAVAAAPTDTGPLTGFTLWDASDQTELAQLADGGALSVDDPDGGSYGIRVEFKVNAEIGSVRLELTGAKPVTKTESMAPYSLYGNDADGLNGEPLPAGEYTLRATAYSEREGNGDELGSLEVSFTVTDGSPQPPPNSPATGLPAISGTAQVGETLTVDTNDIHDPDGTGDAVFTYQWLSEGTEIVGATDDSYTLTDADEGNRIRVRVSFTDDEGNPETLTSEATDTVAGLPPEPLTASLENTPTSHDGEAAFTFELRFSEEPDPDFSYKTLRDHAFTVTGGAVKTAQRLDKPSNILWRITVEPDSNAAVTVVLPITTDCGDQRAVCTGDGRMLSNRTEITVAGPSG